MIINLAKRADDHNYQTDFIIRTLDDTDYYKLLMLQMIWKYPELRDVPVTFAVINRTKSVNLGKIVDSTALANQLDHVRALRWQRDSIDALRGQAFHGIRTMFEPAFLTFLENLRLPPYQLGRNDLGDIVLSFAGGWAEVMLWELYALPIINEMRNREGLKTMNEFELDIFFARAKTKLWDNLQRLHGIPGLRLADFGTRRRFSHLWQDYVVGACKAVLGDAFTGTSNFYMARRHNLEAIGTNAHELPMVLTAMAAAGKLPGVSLREAQYRVLEYWQETYDGALKVFLPDTYGTTQFLENAPDFVAGWTGMRADSKDPFAAGEEYIAWLQDKGIDPRDRLLLLSDGLSVDEIIRLHARFGGEIQPGYAPEDFVSAQDFLDPAKWRHAPRIRVAFGWGTLLTNDFRGCHPRNLDVFDPISLVCKISTVCGQPAVKLSDNFTKATGPAEAIARYRETFGSKGVYGAPVLV